MKEKIKKGLRRQLVPSGNFFLTKGTLMAEEKNAKENIQETGKKIIYNNSGFSFLVTATML